MLLSGEIMDGSTVEVTVQDGHLTINGRNFAEAA
jgi:hypothetical protein